MGERYPITEPVIKEALAEKLRSELAGSFGPLYTNKYRIIPLDELFYSVLFYKDPSTGAKTLLDKQCLSKYWHVEDLNWQNSYIAPPSPPQNYCLQIYTRNSWKYPWGGVIAKLPNLSTVTGYFFLFGFEPGPGGDWGIVDFMIRNGVFYADCQGTWAGITSMLPSDYYTAYHRYSIKLNKSTVEYYIDDVLVAVGVRGVSFTTINGPPYTVLGSYNARVGFDEAPAFIELYYTSVSQYYTDPTQFRAMDGDPLPPRDYPLYLTGTNTKMAGYSISSGSVTSHPVPVFGYAMKTLYFQAGQAGTLSIEALTLTGNWRTYDSVSVSAGTLKVYPMAGDAVLARVTFTPSAYPCTVNDAECILV
jgi:hypothetical protein